MSRTDDLDPNLRALLDEVEPRELAVPDPVRQQMRARMSLALSAAPSPSDAPAAPAPNAAPAAAPPRASLALRLLPHAASAAVGATVASLVMAVATPPRVVYVDRPVPAAMVPPASSSAAAPTPATSAATVSPADVRPAPPPPPRPVVRRPDPAAAPEITDSPLVAESRLIDAARAALSRGEYGAALAAADAHEARFPGGRLAEEREALAVQALAGAKRGTEAHARAERFRQRYPTSLLRDTVDAALANVP